MQTPPARILSASDRSLAYTEATATAIFRNLAGGAFMIPFLLFLGATPMHIGLLGAAPFVGRMVQVGLSVYLSRWGARRATLLAGTGDRLAVLLVATALLWPLPSAWLPMTAIAVLFVSASCGEAFNVSSSVWYAERIPISELGRFGARRVAWGNGASVALMVGVAILLSRTGSGDSFAPWVIGGGAAVGLLGIAAARRIKEARQPVQVAGLRSIGYETREALADRKFMALLRFSLAWNFGVNLSAPFYVTFAVRELGFTISHTSLLVATGAGTGVLFLGLWGRISDRYGNRPLLVACGLWAALVPALWLAVGHPESRFAVFGVEALSGVVWAAVNLSMANLLLKTVPHHARSSWVAVFTALSGVTAVIAPIVGGALVSVVSTFDSMLAFQVLFALSAVLRLSALLLLPNVDEIGAHSLTRSVEALVRLRRGWGTPTGVGTALLWMPLAAESARVQARNLPRMARVRRWKRRKDRELARGRAQRTEAG
jgi:hypothetical protein